METSGSHLPPKPNPKWTLMLGSQKMRHFIKSEVSFWLQLQIQKPPNPSRPKPKTRLCLASLGHLSRRDRLKLSRARLFWLSWYNATCACFFCCDFSCFFLSGKQRKCWWGLLRGLKKRPHFVQSPCHLAGTSGPCK